MKLLPLALVAALTAVLSAPGFAEESKSPASPYDRLVVKPAADLTWTDLDPTGAPGVKVAKLWGDHTKGAYGVFFKLPAGFAVPLHTHTHDIKVVIVSGTYIQVPEGNRSSGSGRGPISCNRAAITGTPRPATRHPSACSSPRAADRST